MLGMEDEMSAIEEDFEIEIGNITEELHDLRRQLEQERQDHREHIAFLQKISAQQIQQAHLRSGWPSAWELWVCRPDRNQDWRRYGLYETHAQAAATMRRVEGPPLELKIVPLYSAFVEHEHPSIFAKTRKSAAKLGETIAEWDGKFGDKAVPNG